MVRAALSAAAVFGILGCVSGAPPAVVVRLENVPPEISLPMPAGPDAMIRVLVDGGTSRDVWVAKRREAGAKFGLARTGEREFCFNLADPDLPTIFGPAGRLRVFVEMEDDRIGESEPIPFGKGAADVPDVAEVFVQKASDAEGGEFEPAGAGTWCNPADVRAILVRTEGGSGHYEALARFRGRDFIFSAEPAPMTGSAALRLDATKEFQALWEKEGEFEILHGVAPAKPGAESVWLFAIPASLDLAAAGKVFGVPQGTSAAVPGSRGYLRVALEAISDGLIGVSITSANDRVIVQGILRIGDSLDFSLGKEAYSLNAVRKGEPPAREGWVDLQILRAGAAPAQPPPPAAPGAAKPPKGP